MNKPAKSQPVCYVIDTRKIRKDARDRLLAKGTVVRCAGLSLILLAGTQNEALAAAAGSTGIDAGANRIYEKLLNVGKWIIIGKGAILTIQNVTDGDLPAAKKNFFAHLIVYAILHALPWGLGEIDKLFDDVKRT